MRKFLWLIAFMVAMVGFTSCSQEEYELDSISCLNGKWKTSGNVTWEFRNGTLFIYADSKTKVEYKYAINKEVITIAMSVTFGDEEAEYYKQQISMLQEELKISRGSRRQYLIDEINRLTNAYREAKQNCKKEIIYVDGTITKLTSKDLIIVFNDQTMYFKKK